MLTVRYARNARKAIEGYLGKQAQQIVRKIEALRTDPKQQDSQALRGKLKPFLRVDVGEYRIIYRVEGDKLMIAAVGRRNDDAIYKEFERTRRG